MIPDDVLRANAADARRRTEDEDRRRAVDDEVALARGAAIVRRALDRAAAVDYLLDGEEPEQRESMRTRLDRLATGGGADEST